MSRHIGSHVILLDMDGTVFEAGTDQFLPGVLERLREWSRDADISLVAFTVRPLGPWVQVLRDNGVALMGYIQKPLAQKYSFYDDRLVDGQQAIPHG